MKLAGAYINDDTYERLVALAMSNNRTLAGQCRHLFDRALKGELQVPDAPPGAAQAAGRKPALRAVAALEGLPVVPGGATVTPPHAAAHCAPPTPLPDTAAAARAWHDSETLPVTGAGVVNVVPVGTGRAATCVLTPVTGLPLPAGCGGCAEKFSTHTPTMMKTHAPRTHHRCRCRPGAAPAPGHTPRTSDTPAAPRTLHTHGRSAP